MIPIIENITNTLDNYEDLSYVLTCTSSDEKECFGSEGVFPKTKKDPNYIFRTALPRYGGNAKMDTVFEHQFEKWYFAGDAHIVIEGV